MEKLSWQVDKYFDYAMKAARWFDDEDCFLNEAKRIVLDIACYEADVYFVKRFREIKNVKFSVGYLQAVSKLEGLIEEEEFEEVYDLVSDYVEMISAEKGYAVSEERKENMIRELGDIECVAYYDEFCLRNFLDVNGLLD